MKKQILLAALLALLCSLPAARADDPDLSGAKKLGWKLTLQAWTMNYMNGDKKNSTTYKALQAAHDLGIHYLECYPGQQLDDDAKAKWGPEMTEDQIKAVLAKAKELDVEIIDTGVIGIPGKESDARKFFDWIKKVGVTTVVTESEEKTLPMIDKVAGEYGLKIALHDHPKPKSRYWDPEYTYTQIKDLKNVGYCADVGHWKRSGLVPAEVLKKHGDRVVSSHFKDLKDGHDVVWGSGDSAAAQMLTELKDKQFKGPIAIEFEYKWDMPTLARCVKFFADTSNELAK